ncbi:hypothetical protein V8E51_003076 [Hyaloscypha variabilis]
MANDIIEQVEPHIREILRLCGVLDAEGGELHKLNELVGRTNKFEDVVFNTSRKICAKAVAVQNHLVKLNGGAGSPCPITVEFKRLRRSGRLASQTKRSYEAMQGANKRTGNVLKKPRRTADETVTSEPTTDDPATDEPPNDASANDKSPNNTPSTDDSANEPAALAINDTAIIKPNTMGLLETSRDALHREHTDGVMANSEPSLVDEATVGRPVDSDLPTITHADGMAILDEYFPISAIDSRPLNGAVAPGELSTSIADTACRNFPLVPSIPSLAPENLNTTPDLISSKSHRIPDPHQATGGVEMSAPNTGSPESVSSCGDSSSCPSSETDGTNIGSLDIVTHPPFARRLVLDETAQLLEHVLVALESAYDDSCIPCSSVPGILESILTKGNHTNFVKIMTSVIENWAKCNRLIAKAALAITQERLREVERNSLKRIGGRCQMNVTHEDRVKSQRLKHTVACLDVRELLGIELQDLLSEPAELIGEFSEESDYENAIKHIEKDNADDAKTRLRRLWKETFYWPMIQQRAKMISPLPELSGPKTEITPQEKLAAKKLIAAMGYGQSRNNLFKWTAYLKLLSDLRDKGATAVLLGRTSEFKSYFFQHPKELDTLLLWNKVYDFPLQQLRLRVIAQEGNDFAGKSDIEEQWICDRLHAPQNMCWGDHLSVWDQDSTEHEDFLANHSLKPTSGKSNTHVLRYGIKGQLDCNKSIYVSFVPYEGQSDKRTLSNKTASTELLAIAPLVAVAPGDFLGLFPGRLRYTDQKPTRAISGPVPNIWLDYSEAMGKLNKIKVAKAGEMTNVCLAWEGVNEVKGDRSFCQYLRVLVIATRHIMPFDQLIRPSSGAAHWT